MRLVDADELMEHVWRDKLDSRELIAQMIATAPTIKEIPIKIPIHIFERLLELAEKGENMFGTAYYVVNEYKNVKRYVSIAIQGDFVFGVRFMESSKYTLLELLNDLCKRSKEDGYTGIRVHHKDECFNTYEEADRSSKE